MKIFLSPLLINFVIASVFSQITINDPGARQVEAENFIPSISPAHLMCTIYKIMKWTCHKLR